MNLSQIPEKPLVPSVGKVEQPDRIFFFERPDGSRIFVLEKEAWGLYVRRPQILGVYTQPFKFLGSSSGKTYQTAVQESQQIFRETGDLQKARERLLKGEEEEFATIENIPPRDMDKMGPGAKLLNI